MTSGHPDSDLSAGDFDQLSAAARDARDSGEHDRALEIWAMLQCRFPDRTEPPRRAGNLLIERTRYEEADALLGAARVRFPDDEGIAIDYAWAGYFRRDVPAALARWEVVRERFPDQPLGFTGAVVALREDGALDEADALLEAACARFPNDPSPLVEQGWMIQARGDSEGAARHWETVRSRFPDHWHGYTGGAVALRQIDRRAEADALLARAARRFPGVYPVAAEFAWLGAVRQDWDAALQRWTAARDRFPQEPDPWIGRARALRQLRRWEEARVALEEASACFPDHPSLLLEAALLAHHRSDWAEAAALWTLVRERQPTELAGWRLGAIAAKHLGRTAEAASLAQEVERRAPESESPRPKDTPSPTDAPSADPPSSTAPAEPDRAAEASRQHAARPAPPVAVEPPRPLIRVPEPGLDDQAGDPVLRAFVSGFLSLGGDHFGAEFGLVQAACGARTMDLLDRADVPFEALCAMLESRFAGVGDLVNTELFVVSDGQVPDEYGARDRRGWFAMRSFIPPEAAAHATMLRAWCGRLRHLAQALAAALAEGDKVFVYRLSGDTPQETDLNRLREAMRGFGARTTVLLAVATDPALADGSVVQVQDGVLIGRVPWSLPSTTPDWFPAIDTWLMALGNARELLAT